MGVEQESPRPRTPHSDPRTPTHTTRRFSTSFSNSALLSPTHPSDSYSPRIATPSHRYSLSSLLSSHLLTAAEGPQHRLFSGRSNCSPLLRDDPAELVRY